MIRCRSMIVSACSVVVAALSFAAAPVTAPPHAAPRGSSPTRAHRGNPHLHGPTVPTSTHDKHPGPEHDHDHWYDRRPWHSRWYGTWNAWAYISLHRGFGSIVGTVQGAPAGSLMVNLRRSNGHTFRAVSKKHTVFASATGNFLMTGVRAGAYRIIAHTPNGKHLAHSQVGVRTGHTSTVGIRW